MKILKNIEKAMNIFTWIFCFAAIVALTFNVLIIVVDVISRYLFDAAIIGSSEYVSVAEVILIFLALGYTQYNHGLVHITFFMKKFPKLSPVILWTLHEWLSTGVAALLTYASWMQAGVIDKLHLTSTALQIPFYPFYIIMMIGFFVYTVVQLYGAFKSTIALFNKEVRQDVMDNWPA